MTKRLLLLLLPCLLLACNRLPGPEIDRPAESQPATLIPTAAAALPGSPADASPTVPLAPSPIPPTPTVDPTLPQWTILVYMAADNNLDPQALANLNQLEAAGTSPEVNVVVQLDRAAGAAWSDTRRYELVGDDDRQAVGSTLLAELGELNSGEAGPLADFIAWGTETYPAQKTALLLWNHGSGWSGVASDDSSGDLLTLPELAEALEIGLAGRGGRRLDLIGFDACLMGQLDVYAAVAPYGRIAVASEELIPAAGWNYEGWLAALLADPDQHAPAAATAAVDTFLEYYRDNPFVTLAAVDLERLFVVNGALRDLTTALGEDLDISAAGLATARYGAETYARAYGAGADTYAAVDLGHLARVTSERALTVSVATAAASLAAAVDQAVLHAGRGNGFEEAHGIALYFPGRAETADPAYEAATPLPGWPAFLNRFHAERAAAAEPPAVAVVHTTPEEPASVQRPAHFAFQLTGREIEEVTLLAGRFEPDGRRQLFELDALIPEPLFLADGSRLYAWQDGLHEDFYIWTTRVTFLTDGNEGQYVVMWPYTREAEGERRSVPGLFTRAASGAQARVNAVFDTQAGRLAAVWGVTAGRAPFELIPEPGDFFQPDRLFLDESGQITSEPGVTLRLDDQAQLAYDWRPVPSGDYFLGFEARGAGGERGRAFVDLAVDNAILAGDSVAYLDPYLGFQFWLPPDWYRPVYRDDVLFTTGRDGQTRLRLTLFPDAAAAAPQTLKEETLALFGPVQLLYEESITVAERPAELTAYGYTGPDGERTGLLVTFVNEGIGYVLDLDGPQVGEEASLDILDTALDSWTFRPVGQGLFPNRWATIDTAGFTLPRPESFVYQPAENGWQRFSAPDNSRIFVAFRREAAGDEPPVLLDRWSGVAAAEVDNFQASEVGRFALGNRLWLRRNFTYDGDGGEPVWGFIMVGRLDEAGGRPVVAWAEAPARLYEEIERTIFEVMLAELR